MGVEEYPLGMKQRYICESAPSGYTLLGMHPGWVSLGGI